MITVWTSMVGAVLTSLKVGFWNSRVTRKYAACVMAPPHIESSCLKL